ncbi:MAG: nitroreductase family protein [Clostridiales bacterium]
MDILDLIGKRQSCRNYQDKPLSREQIMTCLEAARLAPSACNSQPWKFVVVDDQEKKAQLADCLYDPLMKINKFALKAPVFIVVVNEKRNFTSKFGEITKKQDYSSIDIGIAAENICLTATEMGLGSCIIGWFKEEKIKTLLQIPEARRVRLVIALGYPDENDLLRKKSRYNLEEIVYFNQYSK